jgi:hypothetical protein
VIFVKKGWVENRRTDRSKTTILAEYRVIQPAMLSQVQHDANYAKTPVKGDLLNTTALLFNLTTDQLLQSGVLFCSQDPMQNGWWLEIGIKVPKWDVKVRFLAHIETVRPENEMREVIFAAIVRLHAAHKGDLQELTQLIQKTKR